MFFGTAHSIKDTGYSRTSLSLGQSDTVLAPMI
jgi:hypothetical protein